eukprot:3474158-Pyramimonas_sp.AAC.1
MTTRMEGDVHREVPFESELAPFGRRACTVPVAAMLRDCHRGVTCLSQGCYLSLLGSGLSAGRRTGLRV